jgi:hypothetical protein
LAWPKNVGAVPPNALTAASKSALFSKFALVAA